MTIREAFENGKIKKFILTQTEVYKCEKCDNEESIIDEQCDHVELLTIEDFLDFCKSYGRQNFCADVFLEEPFYESEVENDILEIESELEFWHCCEDCQ